MPTGGHKHTNKNSNVRTRRTKEPPTRTVKVQVQKEKSGAGKSVSVQPKKPTVPATAATLTPVTPHMATTSEILKTLKFKRNGDKARDHGAPLNSPLSSPPTVQRQPAKHAAATTSLNIKTEMLDIETGPGSPFSSPITPLHSSPFAPHSLHPNHPTPHQSLGSVMDAISKKPRNRRNTIASSPTPERRSLASKSFAVDPTWQETPADRTRSRRKSTTAVIAGVPFKPGLRAAGGCQLEKATKAELAPVRSEPNTRPRTRQNVQEHSTISDVQASAPAKKTNSNAGAASSVEISKQRRPSRKPTVTSSSSNPLDPSVSSSSKSTRRRDPPVTDPSLMFRQITTETSVTAPVRPAKLVKSTNAKSGVTTAKVKIFHAADIESAKRGRKRGLDEVEEGNGDPVPVHQQSISLPPVQRLFGSGSGRAQTKNGAKKARKLATEIPVKVEPEEIHDHARELPSITVVKKVASPVTGATGATKKNTRGKRKGKGKELERGRGTGHNVSAATTITSNDTSAANTNTNSITTDAFSTKPQATNTAPPDAERFIVKVETVDTEPDDVGMDVDVDPPQDCLLREATEVPVQPVDDRHGPSDAKAGALGGVIIGGLALGKAKSGIMEGGCISVEEDMEGMGSAGSVGVSRTTGKHPAQPPRDLATEVEASIPNPPPPISPDVPMLPAAEPMVEAEGLKDVPTPVESATLTWNSKKQGKELEQEVGKTAKTEAKKRKEDEPGLEECTGGDQLLPPSNVESTPQPRPETPSPSADKPHIPEKSKQEPLANGTADVPMESVSAPVLKKSKEGKQSKMDSAGIKKRKSEAILGGDAGDGLGEGEKAKKKQKMGNKEAAAVQPSANVTAAATATLSANAVESGKQLPPGYLMPRFPQPVAGGTQEVSASVSAVTAPLPKKRGLPPKNKESPFINAGTVANVSTVPSASVVESKPLVPPAAVAAMEVDSVLKFTSRAGESQAIVPSAATLGIKDTTPLKAVVTGSVLKNLKFKKNKAVVVPNANSVTTAEAPTSSAASLGEPGLSMDQSGLAAMDVDPIPKPNPMVLERQDALHRAVAPGTQDASASASASAVTVSAPKKRGRKPKDTAIGEAGGSGGSASAPVPSKPTAPRKPKNAKPVDALKQEQPMVKVEGGLNGTPSLDDELLLMAQVYEAAAAAAGPGASVVDVDAGPGMKKPGPKAGIKKNQAYASSGHSEVKWSLPPLEGYTAAGANRVLDEDERRPFVWTSSKEELTSAIPALAKPLNGVSWLNIRYPVVVLEEGSAAGVLALDEKVESKFGLNLTMIRDFTCPAALLETVLIPSAPSTRAPTRAPSENLTIRIPPRPRPSTAVPVPPSGISKPHPLAAAYSAAETSNDLAPPANSSSTEVQVAQPPLADTPQVPAPLRHKLAGQALLPPNPAPPIFMPTPVARPPHHQDLPAMLSTILNDLSLHVMQEAEDLPTAFSPAPPFPAAAAAASSSSSVICRPQIRTPIQGLTPPIFTGHQMPKHLPLELRAILQSYTTSTPFILVVSSRVLERVLGVRVKAECGLAYLGFFRITGVEENVPAYTPKKELPEGYGGGRVEWKFMLEWAASGQEVKAFEKLGAVGSVRPWWGWGYSKGKGKEAPSSTPTPTPTPTPTYNRHSKAHLNHPNYALRDESVHVRSWSVLPEYAIAERVRLEDGFSVKDESLPAGWYCVRCGRLNFQAMMRFRVCAGLSCQELPGKERKGYALTLNQIRSPQQRGQLSHPYNTYPALCVDAFVDQWEDGMQTFLYVSKADGGVTVKHVFTGNTLALQQEATRLFEEVQVDVGLAKVKGVNSPYFEYRVGQGKKKNQEKRTTTAGDEDTSDTPTWDDVGLPTCLTLARDVLKYYGEMYAELGEVEIARLTISGWVTSGSKRASSPFDSSPTKRPIVLMFLGSEAVVTLTPRSGLRVAVVDDILKTSSSGSGKGSSCELEGGVRAEGSRRAREAVDRPGSVVVRRPGDGDLDRGAGGLGVREEEEDEARALPLALDGDIDIDIDMGDGGGPSAGDRDHDTGSGSGGKKGKEKIKDKEKGKEKEKTPEKRSIVITMVHGDVLVLSGDKFDYSIKRAGTGILLIGEQS